MAQSFTASRIGRLNSKRIERPEVALRKPKQLAAAEPTKGDQERQEDSGPNSGDCRRNSVRELAEPDQGYDRCDSEHQTRHNDQQQTGHCQLGNADLRQQTAGERKQRVTLRVGSVILDVAAARIDGRFQPSSKNLRYLELHLRPRELCFPETQLVTPDGVSRDNPRTCFMWQGGSEQRGENHRSQPGSGRGCGGSATKSANHALPA